MRKNEPQIPSFNGANSGLIVTANYREQEISAYRGNPLIEALPPILSAEQAIDGLCYFEDYDESERSAPNHIRYHLIQNGMKFFSPSDVHTDLERRFSCLIRVGYAERNPMKHGFWNEIAARVDSVSQYGNISLPRRVQWPVSATGFSTIGISGIGKSFSIERVLGLYPQVIHHSKYCDRAFTQSQITWLKLDCPADSSTKGLCLEFFKAVDALLGTNYQRNYGGGRRTQDELLSNMSTVAANQFLGVLVIDEIQRLSFAKSGGADRMLNFFVQLVNTIGVPVVLIGTYRALSLLSGEFSQMRRGTGQGDLIWNRMNEDHQWQLFVESLWRFQYTRKPRSLDDNPILSRVLYDETQGITDLAVKLYMLAQWRAIESGKEEITEGVIKAAAEDYLRIPREVLFGLRTNDKRILDRFEDVYPKILDSFQSSPFGKTANTSQSVRISENTVVPITKSEDKTQKQSDGKHNKKSRESDGTSLNADQITECNSSGENNKKDKASVKATKNILTLRDAVVKWPKLTAYEAIKKAGYMRHVNEFLDNLD